MGKCGPAGAQGANPWSIQCGDHENFLLIPTPYNSDSLLGAVGIGGGNTINKPMGMAWVSKDTVFSTWLTSWTKDPPILLGSISWKSNWSPSSIGRSKPPESELPLLFGVETKLGTCGGWGGR